MLNTIPDDGGEDSGSDMSVEMPVRPRQAAITFNLPALFDGHECHTKGVDHAQRKVQKAKMRAAYGSAPGGGRRGTRRGTHLNVERRGTSLNLEGLQRRSVFTR